MYLITYITKNYYLSLNDRKFLEICTHHLRCTNNALLMYVIRLQKFPWFYKHKCIFYCFFKCLTETNKKTVDGLNGGSKLEESASEAELSSVNGAE